ncbi:NnrS family protein [Roseibium aggregatum]|uniref:NnrS family protein n=1 Tax=Roseibium aggregatum TaxID=187304 RepID=A0A926NZG8_9HYPH|nr:NnrS family protein [Roseibium aggregatum]MBD1546960.1 NnrS family protein [Roseibium aggregatum]
MARTAALKGAGTGLPVFLTAGFRLYFLAAGCFAVLSIAAWIGWLGLHAAGGAFSEAPMAMAPYLWHAHEMIYGYTVAVMAGFFLTAVPNWTGSPSARSAFVATTGLVWLAGRLAIWFSAYFDPLAVAVIDLAFIPLLGLKIGSNLLKKTQLRNVIFLGLLTAMFTGNLLMHLEWLGWTDDTAIAGTRLGLYTSAAMIVIIGGRVVPGFTRNALNRRGYSGQLPQVRPALDKIAILASVLAAVASALPVPGVVLGSLCLVAGIANGMRVAGWRGLLTWREPILWVLHLAFTFLAIAYLALAAAHLTPFLDETSALHLLAIGAVGGMTLAMMTRASLGHAGRPLIVAKPIAIAYLCVFAAALVRAFGTGFLDYFQTMYLSGALWLLGFGLYVWIYLPILAFRNSAAD